MEVKLIAFESLGTRSMCTFIRTDDVSILIDPSMACTSRSGLPPHPTEYEVILRKRAEVLSMMEEVDVVVTSHYHYDHLSPPETELVHTLSTRAYTDAVYTDKILCCKDPEVRVSGRQAERGRAFKRMYSRRAKSFIIADGKSLTFGGTTVSFSPALWHGKVGSVQGSVVGTCVSDGDEVVVHSADVQLLNAPAAEWMRETGADLVIVAGPPLFSRERAGETERWLSIRLLRRMLEKVGEAVVDHHLLRSPEWREYLLDADPKGRAICAAQKIGAEVLNYEVRRAELYSREPVEKEFHESLSRGRLPERLRSAVYQLGIEDVYKGVLRR